MNSKINKINKIINKLNEKYKDYPKCYLDYNKDYELLFATILSAQCTDKRVNLITSNLFITYPTLQSFADANLE